MNSNELVVITSRPDSIANETRRWISRYFPNKFKEVCFTNYKGKRKACLDLGVDLLIEDCLEYALDCVTVSRILLIDEPWNQSEQYPRIERVKSWEEIVNKV